jgi:putative endopeptidase
VGQDDKISTQYAVQIGQGGLTLPDRDYYLKD